MFVWGFVDVCVCGYVCVGGVGVCGEPVWVCSFMCVYVGVYV
jgi:hypothetical protein